MLASALTIVVIVSALTNTDLSAAATIYEIGMPPTVKIITHKLDTSV